MIIFWGSKGVGKTTFLTALFYEIQQSNNKWTMFPACKHSDEFIKKSYEILVKKNNFPPPTELKDPETSTLKFEITQHLNNPIHKLLCWLNLKTQLKLKLDFLDPSGEFFENPELEDHYENFISKSIKRSKGILCLIDPDRKDQKDLNSMSYYQIFYENLIKIKNEFQSDDSFHKIPVPLAICLTKMDQYEDYIHNPKQLAIERMGEVVFNLIERFFNPDLIKFFATSSVGFMEDGAPNLLLSPEGQPKLVIKPKPFNLIEPIKWIAQKSFKTHKGDSEKNGS